MVVGSSSVFGLPAVTVDKEIVDKDGDTELAGIEAVLVFPPVDRGVAGGLCESALDLRLDKNSWGRRRVLSPFD